MSCSSNDYVGADETWTARASLRQGTWKPMQKMADYTLENYGCGAGCGSNNNSLAINMWTKAGNVTPANSPFYSSIPIRPVKESYGCSQRRANYTTLASTWQLQLPYNAS